MLGFAPKQDKGGEEIRVKEKLAMELRRAEARGWVFGFHCTILFFIFV